MGHKKDKEILELLKDRVIEKDRHLEEKEVHNSTKEALAEMTALSKNEVDKIYRDVVIEVREKQRKKRKITIIIGSVLVLLAVIIIPIALKEEIPPITFTEDFNDNSNGWEFTDTKLSQTYYENNEYVIESVEDDGTVKYINHTFEFPQNFVIEAKFQRIDGEHTEGFGMHIGENENTLTYFFIRADKNYRYGTKIENDWKTNTSWNNNSNIKKENKEYNIIKIVVKANNFDYFINDEKAVSGDFLDIKPKMFSLAVVGTQKVAYNYIKITNSDNKKIIYDSNFEQSPEDWKIKKDFKKKSEFKDGKYLITTNKTDYCYWAKNWIPEKFTNKEFEIKLDAISLSKEKCKCNYGFMLIYDSDNYFAFEIKDNKTARLLVNNSGKYTYKGNYKEFRKTNNSIQIQIKVEKRKVTLKINNILIDKVNRNYLYKRALERMALRVCDKHTVAFDKLELIELKQ